MSASDYKQVVLYKPGSLTRTGIRDLRAAGCICVEVRGEFSEIQFRAADGFGIEDIAGDAQLMIVKAALDSFSFGDKLGALIVNKLKKKVKEAEAKPA